MLSRGFGHSQLQSFSRQITTGPSNPPVPTSFSPVRSQRIAMWFSPDCAASVRSKEAGRAYPLKASFRPPECSWIERGRQVRE